MTINFFDEKLESTSKEPVLRIRSEFTECGEWGGHDEYLVVSKKDKNSFKLNYEKYDVNCDSMIQVYDGLGYVLNPKRKLITSKEIEITSKEKQAILDFSIDMVKSKFREEYSGHSGISLSIVNSDSTFFISTYGGGESHYLKLINALNLN